MALKRQIDTSAPAYIARRQQFEEIKAFYGPVLRDYLRLRSVEARAAWRAADPFLASILDLVRRVNEADIGE